MSTLAILFAAAQAVVAPGSHMSQACLAIDAVPPRGAHNRAEQRSRRGPRFSTARTVDLELRVQMRPSLQGDHLLHLKLFTPRGFLYQEMTIPFRFDARHSWKRSAEHPASMRVPGFPRPLLIQSLEMPDHGRPAADRVTARLPVAGTSIALGSLFGRWTAVPFLDDATAPCGGAGSFVIAE
jgi:hypothetical protein